MTPKHRAQQDYREEGGQCSNPYDREKEPQAYFEYAWEMHRLWAEEFQAETNYGKALKESGENHE